MKIALALAVGAACLLMAQAPSPEPGQEPPQAPVDSHAIIRSDTRLVLVDTVVTDKKGNYVHDLTQKDFKVYEDNKEQTITTFSHETGPAPDGPRTHYLVLFFDNSTAGPSQQVYAREAATKFIDKNAGPNRLMAIAEFGGTLRLTQDFTDDADRLKQVVAGVKFASIGRASGGGSMGGRMGGAINDFSIRGVLAALRSMAKGLSDLPGRKTLVFLSGGFPLTEETIPEVTATIDACNRANVAIYPIDIRGLVTTPMNGGPRGPRGMNFFGALAAMSTPVTPATMPVSAMGFQARTGGVSTGGGHAPTGGGNNNGGGTHSPTTGRGNGTNSGGGGSAEPINPNSPMNRHNGLRNVLPPIGQIGGVQEGLYALANGTGGFVIVNTNDLLGGMEKIGKEQNEYYVLGYTPSKEPEPGACHTLRVKLDQGGTVRSRSGYCEAKGTDVLSGTPAERDLEARIAGNAAPTVAGASMLTPFFYISPNTARVNVALDIPAGTIHFAKGKRKFQSTMNVVGIAYLPDGSVAARFSDSVKTAFDDKKEVEAFDKKPFHYEKQFEMAPGEYSFKLVFSSSAEQLGRLEMRLTIEPWDTNLFAMSGLALSRSMHPVKDMTAGLDDQLLENRVPLIVSGIQITPAGSNHFKKSEKNFVYAEIYEPAMAAADVADKDVPAVGVKMELLDVTTGLVKKDFGTVRLKVPPATGNPTIPMGLVVSAPELDAGTYKLRVTAMDAAGHQFARTADIQLEN